MKTLFIIIVGFASFLVNAQDRGIVGDEFINIMYINFNRLCIFNLGDSPGDELSLCSDPWSAEYYRFIKQSDGYYYIINQSNGLYLEPKSNPVVAGTRVIQNKPKGTDHQKWKILPGRYFNNIYHYYIFPKTNDDLYLTERGGRVILSEFSVNKCEMLESAGEQSVIFTDDCFPSDALVLTKESYTYIELIKRGDIVASWNTETHRLEYSEVDTILRHSGEEYNLTRLSFVNHNMLYAASNEYYHVQLLEATSNHPLLTPNGFKPVGEISEGDIIYYHTEFSTELQECLVVRVEKDLLTVNEVYNIRLTNGMPYIVNHAVASPKCPYVSVIVEDEWFQISEILRNQLSKLLDKYEEITIPLDLVIDSRILNVRIDERKDEISYIDHLYLLVDDQIIYPEYYPEIKAIFNNDNVYKELHKGDFIDLEFILPEKAEKIKLVVKGYYVLL